MPIITNYDQLMNPDKVFVAFDVETTGLSPSYDRIVELGGVKFQDGKVLEIFNELVDPEIPMPPEVSKINGITPGMLVGKPKIAEILPQFLKFIDGAVLVAHNAEFDVSFVNWAMKRMGLGLLTNDVVDTLRMSQAALPGRKNYKLQEIAPDVGVVALDAHRACDDSRVCMEVFHVCLDKLNPGRQAFFF